jgi:hypothetical protein
MSISYSPQVAGAQGGITDTLGLRSWGAGVAQYTGALDGKTTGLLATWGLSYRLLGSYTEALFRVRRTGDDELDIAALANGMFDLAALSGFVGSDPWWFSQFYDQSGNGIHLSNGASSQPQGGIDGNGLVYAFAPGSDGSTAFMTSAAMDVAATDTTHWTVGNAASFAMAGVSIADSAKSVERNGFNFSTSILANFNDSGDGTTAECLETNTGLYSHVLTVAASGNILRIGPSAQSGTRTSLSLNINQVSVGYSGGSPWWSQYSKFYGGGLWTADLGDAAHDAVQQIGRDLFSAQ